MLAGELLHHLFAWEIVPGVAREDDDEPADVDATAGRARRSTHPQQGGVERQPWTERHGDDVVAAA